MRSCQRTQHLKQIEKVKKLDKWVPHELARNLKKYIILKCHLLWLCNNKEPFLDWIVMCDEKWILHDNQWWLAQWLNREETPKHFPKPNLHPQKRLWSLFGGVLPVWSMTDFWILVKPLHLRIMFSKSMRCTKNCNAYMHDNVQLHNAQVLQKLNKLGYEVLPHPPYSPDLLPTNYHFFKHLNKVFAGKLLLQQAGGRKYFPRVHQIQKHGFLHYRNKQTYFLLAKMCWL